MKIKVRGHETIMNTIYYDIDIEHNEQVWQVSCRFSELFKIKKKFKLRNKNKSIPDFPPKKLFGNEKKKFVEQRQIGLENYFNNLIKYEKKLNYDMTVWIEFFILNKSHAQRDSELISDKHSNLEPKMKKSMDTLILDDKAQKNTDDRIYDEFCKNLVLLENNIFSFEDQHRSGFPVNSEMNTMGYSLLSEEDSISFENKNPGIIQDIVEFCGQMDDFLTNKNTNMKKRYEEKIVHTINLNDIS